MPISSTIPAGRSQHPVYDITAMSDQDLEEAAKKVDFGDVLFKEDGPWAALAKCSENIKKIAVDLSRRKVMPYYLGIHFFVSKSHDLSLQLGWSKAVLVHPSRSQSCSTSWYATHPTYY